MHAARNGKRCAHIGDEATVRPIDYFDRGADRAPDRIALSGSGVELTYAQARDASIAIARGLHASGLIPGDACAVFAPNDPRAMLSVLGVIRAGGAWVPVNVRNPVDVNAQYMAYVRTRWLLYHSAVAAMVEQLRGRLPELRGAVCIDRPCGRDPGMEEFVAAGAGLEVPDWGDEYGNPDHPLSLWPTGGTTGPSKGVFITNRAWTAMLEMGMHYWDAGVPPVCLAVAPITHAAGGMALILAGLSATNVILPGFDAGEVLESIERHRVTHMFLPPTALYALLAHPRARAIDSSSLRQLLVAAAPVSPDKLREAVEVFGPCICQCYGQAESPFLLAWLPPETVAAAVRGDHPERLKSCGRVTSACRVEIMDDAGRLLPRGERGEIVARGPLVTPGYYERPEATAEIRAHRWHHTGDVGYLDADGYLYIVDRKKDMIITGGFNVYAAEVEEPLLALPQVKEAAVIGVPDETWGEAVKAVLVLKPGTTLDAQAVIAHCREKLGSVKAPKSVEFRDAIPKTPNGKVDKKLLRADYWRGQDRAVH
jgi:acyl-CoA synthetase (AMP-forming)/AMP-acid ligase II